MHYNGGVKVIDYKSQWLTDIELPLANKFYRYFAFRGKAKRHEDCAIVRYQQNELVACAYLRRYEHFKLLAGVAVAPMHQGVGVARCLLHFQSSRFDDKTYTFPYVHLQPFYESLGFVLVDMQKVDAGVMGLFKRYRDQGRNIILMLYHG
ncbi:GNAT family N-acetyltransferase [uncultured Shewanella sp.]|uniref:GNAT family N-acetyltransferase n=1 Tax=uncultured Shewanella sp. TaxID=173975 RepID=UPI00262D1684|nr:GNAT family N-acetyltransferase [uncultured Shewanella sp.]